MIWVATKNRAKSLIIRKIVLKKQGVAVSQGQPFVLQRKQPATPDQAKRAIHRAMCTIEGANSFSLSKIVFLTMRVTGSYSG